MVHIDLLEYDANIIISAQLLAHGYYHMAIITRLSQKNSGEYG